MFTPHLVPRSFSQVVLAWFWLVRLLCQQVLDVLGSCEFLGQGVDLHGRLVAEVFNHHLWAIFLESAFKDVSS